MPRLPPQPEDIPSVPDTATRLPVEDPLAGDGWRHPRGRVLEPLLLIGALLCPFLDMAWGAVGLALVLGVWLFLGPPRRESLLAGAALAAAVLILAAGWLRTARPAIDQGAWEEAAAVRYQRLWQDLEGLSGEAVQALEGLPQPFSTDDDELRRQAFQRLEDPAGSGATVVLLDRVGEVFAWAGDGLLHQLEPEQLPQAGAAFRSGFDAVTLFFVQPVTSGPRPWRVVVGRSLSTATLPFASPGSLRRRDFRWSLAERVEQADPGTWRLRVEGLPLLVAEPTASVRQGRWRPAPRGVQAAALLALALAFLALGVLRGVGLVLRDPTSSPFRTGVPFLALAAVGAAAFAATGSWLPTASLVGGLALVLPGLVWGGRLGSRRSTLLRTWLGAFLGAPGLVAVAWALQRWAGGPVDLSSSLGGGATAICLRLSLAAAAFAVLLLAAHPDGRRDSGIGDRWAWSAVALLALAGAVHDRPLVALLSLALGLAVAATWLGPADLRQRPGRFALLLTLASVAGACAWEVAYRLEVRATLAESTLGRMAPPSEAELRQVGDELGSFFTGLDLDHFSPRTLVGLDTQDIAFLLWRSSPLARHNTLSALVVEPDGDVPSSFAFGLTLSDQWESAQLPSDLQGLPRWDELEERGVVELQDQDGRWGQVRFWLRPRPGFGLAGPGQRGNVAAELLATGQPAGTRIDGLPGEALYGLYAAADGRALRAPWEEAPPLPAALRRGLSPNEAVATPEGPARTFSRLETDGWEVLFLLQVASTRALERVGTQATATLLLLAAAALLVLILALPRPGFRQLLHRVLHSYSKRLLILYTLLVLVPLPLLNLAFIAGVKERLWLQQKAAGEGALLAAQRYLLEDLENLPLGFSLDFTFAERLRELSSIIRHDVNLYYGSRESRIVSSRPELFAAGLLPKRVPGEVFSRLSLEGYNLTSRQREVEDTAYVELYAPLRVTPTGPVRFILSVPLLAQQEEVAEQLGHLRRHSILVTALLFAILVTVSARLAQGFAAPITQLVEGTRRIAAGASSLNLAPTEWELAELVQAVDDMAARIALGRRQLLREKHVVERIVEHITSGVVSLDRQRRVLMHNQVAAQMVGTRTGVSLDELLAENPQLGPVRDFLARAGDGGPVQEAVKLSLGEGEDREWSLIWVPIAGTDEPASLLVVEDATEVLRGQRLEAWAEMARIIAHEIKNPLTPIRLSTEHLREVYRRDPAHLDTVFERCTTNILKQVEELRLIATEFSTYSSILHIDPHTGDLAAAVGELVESYQTAPPPGVRILYQPPAEGLEARFDDRLLGRAVRNLLENAVRASAGGGEVTVTVRREAASAVIRVTDRGSGVEPGLLAKIFDPYFSTYDTGTGLGLPISRRIVEEHGGTILARNREGGGLEVEITIPAL